MKTFVRYQTLRDAKTKFQTVEVKSRDFNDLLLPSDTICFAFADVQDSEAEKDNPKWENISCRYLFGSCYGYHEANSIFPLDYQLVLLQSVLEGIGESEVDLIRAKLIDVNGKMTIHWESLSNPSMIVLKEKFVTKDGTLYLQPDMANIQRTGKTVARRTYSEK